MKATKTRRVLKSGNMFFLFFIFLFSLCISDVYAYPAPQFHRGRVVSAHYEDGSLRTIFFAVISGPSPDDVASFTATGPSGTYSLAPSSSFQQYGLYYVHVEDSILENGNYTLTVTDSTGRTASVVRQFIYNDSLPKPTSLVPETGSYVGTTTPTLSFSELKGEDYCYLIQILDYDLNAIWYRSPFMTTPSITVPDNMLQPNTPYVWIARIYDIAVQNFREARGTFYTGTKSAPEINMWGILSFPWGENDLMNYPYARGVNVAPWDIEYFQVTGPNRSAYELNRRYYRFWLPVYNAAIISFEPPASLPDGTYTYEIKDNLGQKVSKTKTYSYDPVPGFVEDSRIPADNTYLDTMQPTFSWSRVEGDTGNGEYLYGIRIMDYRTRVRWFDSPKSTKTSYTPEQPLNLPKGNTYKWQVDVIDASGNNFNSSGYRVLTFDAESAPSIAYVNNADDTCGGKEPCYTSIQSAIYYAAETASIRLAQGTYNEIYSLYLPKTLTLQGGWDAKFENQTANRTFIKSPKVIDGSLTMQMLTIQP